MPKVFDYGAGRALVLRAGNRARPRRKYVRAARKTVAAVVKREIDKNVEFKHLTINNPTLPTADSLGEDVTLPYQTCMTLVPQVGGLVLASDSTRIGDKIKVRSITIRISFLAFGDDATPANNPNGVNWRVMVVQDRSYSATGVAPVVNFTQLLVPDTAAGSFINSNRNADHQHTLIVLYDRTFSQAIGSDLLMTKQIRVPMKWCKKEIQYSNGSTFNQTNQIHLLVMALSAPNPSTSPPSISYQYKMNFTDS